MYSLLVETEDKGERLRFNKKLFVQQAQNFREQAKRLTTSINECTYMYMYLQRRLFVEWHNNTTCLDLP